VTHRRLTPELMDDPSIDPGEHAHALRGLARLNALSGIRRTVARELRALANGAPCTVLDVAAGSGDLVISLASDRRNAARFTASDISALACEQAVIAAERRGIDLATVRLDALEDDLPEHDIVMCHLFLHHLEDEQIVALLLRMAEAARKAILVTDLARTRLGYTLAYLASRLCTRSRVVHTDALLSVRAALTPEELSAHAEEAGLGGVRIRRVWPERMVLTWTR
jgi:2-polyprenyl-3-methyl-5-hydroxy-6-metoxy-1,4-benzoquinol methylase